MDDKPAEPGAAKPPNAPAGPGPRGFIRLLLWLSGIVILFALVIFGLMFLIYLIAPPRP